MTKHHWTIWIGAWGLAGLLGIFCAVGLEAIFGLNPYLGWEASWMIIWLILIYRAFRPTKQRK